VDDENVSGGGGLSHPPLQAGKNPPVIYIS